MSTHASSARNFEKEIIMMRKIVACWRFCSVFVFIVCCMVIIGFVLPRATPQERGRLIRRWAGRLLVWLGIRVDVSGDVQCQAALDTGISPGEVGRLLVSNHVSFLDVFVLDSVLPAGFVAKAEIANWPVFGKIALCGGNHLY